MKEETDFPLLCLPCFLLTLKFFPFFFVIVFKVFFSHQGVIMENRSFLMEKILQTLGSEERKRPQLWEHGFLLHHQDDTPAHTSSQSSKFYPSFKYTHTHSCAQAGSGHVTKPYKVTSIISSNSFTNSESNFIPNALFALGIFRLLNISY